MLYLLFPRPRLFFLGTIVASAKEMFFFFFVFGHMCKRSRINRAGMLLSRSGRTMRLCCYERVPSVYILNTASSLIGTHRRTRCVIYYCLSASERGSVIARVGRHVVCFANHSSAV